MSEGEKTQFKGNLALLRVCAIVFMVNVLGFVINMFFMAGQTGTLSSLWNAITTSSFEDCIGMIGMMIASGVFFPVLLSVLAIAFLLGLAIFALVKKNVTALKILAVFTTIWIVVTPVIINYVAGTHDFASVAIGMVFNANFVAVVAAFFVAPRKRVEENKDVAVCEGFNLGLYRFCAAFFLVYGLNGSMSVFLGHLAFPHVLFSFVAVMIGIFALVKKNTGILTVCAIIMVVQIFISLFQILNLTHISGGGFFATANVIAHCFLNATMVACVASFFVEPERTRSYLQCAKRVLFRKK